MGITYCCNCIHWYDAREPKKSLIGAMGLNDRCNAKDAPINDYLRGLKIPELINTDGVCKFYQEKSILEVATEKDNIS